MAQAASRSRSAELRRALPFAGLVIGLWAVLPPYTGPEINTETRVEVADHVVPSILMLALSLAMLFVRRRADRSPGAGASFPLLAGFGVLLAGFWMVATHIPLVSQARRGQVTNGAAAYHTVPGVVVLLLGLAWVALYWSSGEPAGGSTGSDDG